jgi:uncharacterized protein (TIGR02145 family)
MKLIYKIKLSTIILVVLLWGLLTCCERKIREGQVTDIDRNVYKTIKIGKQWWMAENLRTTLYNDGSHVPNIKENSEWIIQKTGAYCWYNNDLSNKSVFGALYNWYAVNTGKLCPTKWHVPTYNEWTILIDYLGGNNMAGGKLKAVGTLEVGDGLWKSPNTGATDKYGFKALPGGKRIYNGIFGYPVAGVRGDYWTSTVDNSGFAWERSMLYNSQEITSGGYQSIGTGFSVRCIKDNHQ